MKLDKFTDKLANELSIIIRNDDTGAASRAAIKPLREAIRSAALELPLELDDLEEQGRVLSVMSSMDRAIERAFTISKNAEQTEADSKAASEAMPPLHDD